MIIFDGNKLARQKEAQLKQKIERDFLGTKLVIAAILFTEDAGSRLYTRLKGEAAARVGMEYRIFEFSLSDQIQQIQAKLEELGSDPEVTGIIIQKPWRKTWVAAQNTSTLQEIAAHENPKKIEKARYAAWWKELTSYINQDKDVDGLHPMTIQSIAAGTYQSIGRVLPATCQAVLDILHQATLELSQIGEPKKIQTLFSGKYLILGKSDLLGIPLFYELKNQGKSVEIIASKELEERIQSGQKLLDATVIVSATGTKGLITADMIAQDSIVIDVGEPYPDVAFESVSKKALFITPVPGGVGPLTVMSLLENCVKLGQHQSLGLIVRQKH